MNADVHSLAGPYALDALPPDERASFEAHLASCPTCQSDVTEFRLTGARLGAVAVEEPPPALKSRVLTEVRKTRQLSPPVVPIKRRGVPRRTWLVAAAALVVAGAGGVTAIQVSAAQQAERERDTVASVLAAPDSRTFHGAVRGGGTVTLLASPGEDAAVVVLDHLPAAPSGKDYQLWMIHGSRPVSAGVVEHDKTGRVVRVMDESVQGANGFGLTVEPAGGSDKPTLPTIAEVALGTG